MKENNFSEYIKTTESKKYHMGYLWDTVIGLLEAEGLETSRYLWETALQTVYGEISVKEAEQQINAYYNQETWKRKDRRAEEADRIATRTALILSDTAFYFSPDYYLNLHRILFKGIYEHAGEVRTIDITRKESILDDIYVFYGDADELLEALKYGMSLETDYSYLNLPVDEAIRHIAQFFARLWQLHIFEKGNTVTTALFLIKYLDFLGLEIASDAFSKNSKYFRNALVRANYSDEEKGIYARLDFLEVFLRNLILKESNPLRNDDMLVRREVQAKTDPIREPIKNAKDDPINLEEIETKERERNDISTAIEEFYAEAEESMEKIVGNESRFAVTSREQDEDEGEEKNERDNDETTQNAINIDTQAESSDPINDPIKLEGLSRREQAIYKIIEKDSRLNRNDMAKKLKCSEATIKRAVVSLTNKGLIERVGSNKTGYWRIVAKIGE